MQTRHAQVKRIVHHRDRRLRHARIQASRQMVAADCPAFIFQHQARRVAFKQFYRQRIFKACLRTLCLQRAAK